MRRLKILLDESVPIQVRNALTGHDVRTAVEIGWRGVSNGELLDRAEAEAFHLLIIADKNLRYQQNLSRRRVAILELWTNHRPTLESHFARIRTAVESTRPATYVVLDNET